jgi:hypothetical protein
MHISVRLQVTLWLAIVVGVVALVSHAFGQPQDVTLVLVFVSCCLLALDWVIAPHGDE